MKVYILMTQWKDGDPEVAGIFSSLDKAVSYFVRTELKDASGPLPELLSRAARMALKMTGQTDDEDLADFGNTRAWVEDRLVDGWCERFEKEGQDDCGTP